LVIDPDKDRENKFRDVVEDQFDFEFLDLFLEFPCFQGFSKLSFEDRSRIDDTKLRDLMLSIFSWVADR